MTKNEKVIGIVGVLLTLAIALYALVGSNQSVPVDEIVSKVVSQLSSKVPDILGAVGTRFPNGVSVGVKFHQVQDNFWHSQLQLKQLYLESMLIKRKEYMEMNASMLTVHLLSLQLLLHL